MKYIYREYRDKGVVAAGDGPREILDIVDPDIGMFDRWIGMEKCGRD